MFFFRIKGLRKLLSLLERYDSDVKTTRFPDLDTSTSQQLNPVREHQNRTGSCEVTQGYTGTLTLETRLTQTATHSMSTVLDIIIFGVCSSTPDPYTTSLYPSVTSKIHRHTVGL